MTKHPLYKNGGKMRYTLSKMSVFGCFLCIIGVIFTIQGIIVRYNLANIKESYSKFEIKNGRYIEYDITMEYLIGSYYTNPDGSIKYGPYCSVDAYSLDQTYIVAINNNLDYYVPLLVIREYQKEFEKIINSTESCHLFCKIEKSNHILDYDIIAKCTGINNKSDIDYFISSDYQLRIANREDEEKILYKGLFFLLVGLLIFFVTLKKKEIHT